MDLRFFHDRHDRPQFQCIIYVYVIITGNAQPTPANGVLSVEDRLIVAAVAGDLQGVNHALDQGANPNYELMVIPLLERSRH